MPSRSASRAGRLRGRHADDVEAGAHPLGQQLDEMPRGRAGAEPEPHAGPHPFEREGGGLTFLRFDVHERTLFRLRTAFGTGRLCSRVRDRSIARTWLCPNMALTVVFDLDGTLVDTAPDLIDTLNVVFAREQLPPVPYDAGAQHDRRRRPQDDRGADSSSRAARSRPDELDRMFRRFHRALFRPHRRPLAAVSRARSRARPARRARLPLRGLHQQARMAVAAAARRARPVAALRGDLRPGHVRDARSPTRKSCGGRSQRPAAHPRHAVMVGDSGTDIATARAAGIPVIAVDFGYTETADRRAQARPADQPFRRSCTAAVLELAPTVNLTPDTGGFPQNRPV